MPQAQFISWSFMCFTVNSDNNHVVQCRHSMLTHSLLRKQDLLAAGAEDVAEAGAQLAAVAGGPTDAHVGGDVLLDAHVALVVAVLADDHAFEAGTGTL